MVLTVLGTGGPIPTLNRGGTALAIRIDGEPILVDCGPKTVYGLLEAEIDPLRFGICFLLTIISITMHRFFISPLAVGRSAAIRCGFTARMVRKLSLRPSKLSTPKTSHTGRSSAIQRTASPISRLSESTRTSRREFRLAELRRCPSNTQSPRSHTVSIRMMVIRSYFPVTLAVFKKWFHFPRAQTS